MSISHFVSMAGVAAGAALLLLAIRNARRFSSRLDRELRGRWQTANGLMHFFVVGYLGYLGYMALLWRGRGATIELLNASIFLGGAVFVLLVVGLSRATLERVWAQQLELLRSQNLWQDTFDSIGDAITIHDTNFNVLRANRTARELLEFDEESCPGAKCYQVYHGSERPPEGCPSCLATTEGRVVESEVFEPKIGKHLLVKAFPLKAEEGERTGVVHVVRDVSEQKRAAAQQRQLEEQLIQAQKMEAVGRLAGGVAHDFNNILSVVLTYSELCLDESGLPDGVDRFLRNIQDAGTRAAGLTRQLLAFSRKQVLEVTAVELVELTENLANMLRVMLGEDVNLKLDLQPVTPVLADPGQVEQILMNLAVNARDAMPRGGTLTITTRQLVVEEADLGGRRGLIPGAYVVLTVRDSGEGIPDELQDRIFEPFFTTKVAGKGTGLGLATVYGIVKQHNGYIEVESRVGSGTAFHVYLPPAPSQEDRQTESQQRPLPRGEETLLIVDDEESILTLAEWILIPLGYRVLTATSGRQALQLAASEPPDLLITDTVMPEMNGPDLATRLGERQPGVPTLYVSGYTDDVIANHGLLEPGIQFLYKPLTPEKLSAKVRAVLDGGGA